MLVGADIAAAATILKAMSVDAIGLNCATGPKEMMEHVRFLSESVDVPITVQPNAGLPELIDGETVYPLRPDELAEWLRRFVTDHGVNLIGGCCGTTPEHIQALDRMLGDLGRNRRRPEPAPRTPEWTPPIASLFTQTPLRVCNWKALARI